MPAADVSDIIDQTAAEPASAAGDAGSATAHPLPDLIALQRFKSGEEALTGSNSRGGRRSGFNALRTGVFVPRGAV
jgi:hypothetical protein